MELSLTPDALHVRLRRREQLLAMTPWRELDVPLTRIRGVRAGRPDTRSLSCRGAGTCVRGLFYAGSYHVPQGAEFWYAHPRHACLELELQGGPYRRCVLEVEAPEAWAARLRRARAAAPLPA